MSTLAETPADNLYHIAFLVESLDRGRAEFGGTLGCDWTVPRTSQLAGPSGAIWDVSYTYSLSGPPFVELIEAVDDPESVFSLEFIGGRPGLHHVGIYAERWRDEVHRLEAAGMTRVLTGNGMAFVTNPLGLTIEVVSWKGRSFLYDLMAANGVRLGSLDAREGT